jgi:hypothetical protein
MATIAAWVATGVRTNGRKIAESCPVMQQT